MYILQNAFRNILRNSGRNILIGTIIFAVIITSVIALMISNTASGIIDDYKSRFGAEVMLEPNMQKIRDEAMANSTDGKIMVRIPSIPPDQYIIFGESEYLQSSIYTASTGVNSDFVTAIDAELGGGSGMRIMGGPNSTNTHMQFMMNLVGNNFAEFDEGARAIAEGVMPQGLNECIISTDLAEANGLGLGDTISLYSELIGVNLDTKEELQADTAYNLVVVGTYYDATDEYSEGSMKNAFTNRRNEILTNYDTVVQELQTDMSGIKVDAKYYLKEPGLLDAFAEEVYAKGLATTFNVTTDEASYNKIVGPVEGLKGVAVTFMIVVLVFGGIIIALLSSIAIRERKYEIGVLRAMGMKKHVVAFGLWAEMLMITCICLVFGLGVGGLAAQPVTNSLLANQVEAAKAAENTQSNQMGMMMQMPSLSESSKAEPLSDIDISLAPLTMMQITVIALLLASLAGLVSVSRITKYEPIKILMERN